MNRELMARQMFAGGGQVYKMQEGGVPPVNPMAGMPVSPDAAMPPMAGAAGVDPAMMEQMLMQAQQNITALDDAQSAEEVMNAMRGDQASIEERRMELAQIVGEGDAQSTPESVLTLVQPVMMMAQVDQGIGALAQDQMNQPVTGDMAGGIMSTVDMGAEEGPAPVNFKYGGVVGMAMGGDPFTAPPAKQPVDPYASLMPANSSSLEELYNKNLGLLQGVMGPSSVNDDKDYRQAQGYFALADAALTFAGRREKGESAAEKLARSGLRFIQNTSSIVADAQKAKKEAEAQQRQLRLAALQQAQSQDESQRKLGSDILLKQAEFKTKQLEEKAKREYEESSTLGKENRELFRTLAKEERDLSRDISKEDREEKRKLAEEERKRLNQVVDPDKVITLSLFNPETEETINLAPGVYSVKQIQEFEKENPGFKAQVQPKIKPITTITMYGPKGDVKTISNTETDEFFKLQGLGYVAEKPDATSTRLWSKGDTGSALEILTNTDAPDLAKKYGDGDTNAYETNLVETTIDFYTNPQRVWDADQGQFVSMPGHKLPPMWKRAVKERAKKVSGSGVSSVVGTSDETITAGDGAVGRDSREVPIVGTTYEDLIKDIEDASDVTGRASAVAKLVNKGSEFLIGGLLFEDIAKTQTTVGSMNTGAISALVGAVPGKESEQFRQELKAILPDVAKFTTGAETALNQTEGAVAYFNQEIMALNRKLTAPNTPQMVGDIEYALENMRQFRNFYNSLALKLRSSLNRGEGTKPPLSKFMKNSPEYNKGED